MEQLLQNLVLGFSVALTLQNLAYCFQIGRAHV